jgi:hypothetical protein
MSIVLIHFLQTFHPLISSGQALRDDYSEINKSIIAGCLIFIHKCLQNGKLKTQTVA